MCKGEESSEFDNVFVFGSGFSNSFSSEMPTISTLENRLFKDRDSIRDSYPKLINFIEDVIEKSNNADELNDLQNICTVIFSKKIYFDYEEKSNHLDIRFELLKFIFDNIYPSKLDSKSDELMNTFLAYAFQEKCPIISTNYDLLIERYLPSHISNIDYGIPIQTYITGIEKIKEVINSDSLRLIKLHGSFNWFRILGSADGENDIRSIYLVNEDNENFELFKNELPIFIPMSYGKEGFLFGNLYNSLWAKADFYLKRAKKIIFVGYGFPKTDVNNLTYFLKFKDKIGDIVVYGNNKESEENEKRLKKIFNNSNIQNIDAKEFLSTYESLPGIHAL